MPESKAGTVEATPPIRLVKCNCGDPGCDRYAFSDGTFYQGNGWPKEVAERHLHAVNSYDATQTQLGELKSALRRFIPKCARCGSNAKWIGSMTGVRMCDEHKRESSYIDEDVAVAIAALLSQEEG